MSFLSNLFGGSKAQNTLDSLSQTITNISTSVVQKCGVVVSQNQDVNISNSGWGLFNTYSVSQTTDVNSQCFSDSAIQNQLQTEISNALAQSTSSDGVALWGAFGSTQANATANIQSIVNNNVTLQNIQNNYNSVKQGQTVIATNSGTLIGSTIDISQGAQVYAAAVLKTLNDAGVFNTITNYVSQSASSTQAGPFDFISSIFSGITSTWIFAAVFIFVVIIALIYAFKDDNQKQGGYDFELGGYHGGLIDYYGEPLTHISAFRSPIVDYEGDIYE